MSFVGIDFGLSESLVAICDGERPRILDNREAKPSTPSVVGARKKRGANGRDFFEIVVGAPAIDNWPLAPRDTIFDIQRLLGRHFQDPEVQRIRTFALYSIVEAPYSPSGELRLVMGDGYYSSVDIAAMILRELKEQSEFRLGGPITGAVVAVPAYFTESQKAATREAGCQAGFKTIKIIDRPFAAALSVQLDLSEGEPRSILILDVEEDTFDVGVLMVAGNVYAVTAIEGDMRFGSRQFDQVLVNEAVHFVKREYGIDPSGNMRFMVELKRAAEKTKESLSSNRTAYLMVTGLLQDGDGSFIDIEMEIEREAYARMTRPLVDRQLSLIKGALDRAALTREEINHILLVGGGTILPLLGEMLKTSFETEKILPITAPRFAIAFGAARFAAKINDQMVDSSDSGCVRLAGGLPPDETIAPCDYAAKASGDKFDIFVKKGEPFPTENAQWHTFYTTTPNARTIRVPLYAGENLEELPSLHEKQGEVCAILPPGLPQNTSIRIKLSLDADGIFVVSAQLEDDTDLHAWVLKGEKDAQAIEVIEYVEQRLMEKGPAVPISEKQRVDMARDKIFEEMKEGNFSRALQQAERLKESADGW